MCVWFNDGTKFDLYSNIQTFFSYLIQKFTAVQTNILEYFPSCHSCPPPQYRYRVILLSDLTLKTTTYHQITPHICYIHLHTLGYKIKSLTLVKQINFTKHIHAKLAGNAASLPSMAITRGSSPLFLPKGNIA